MTILTDRNVSELRELVAQGVPQKILARRYGISQPTVSSIASGRRRPESPGPITQRARKTHCINGHLKTEENQWKLKTGYTACKDCYTEKRSSQS